MSAQTGFSVGQNKTSDNSHGNETPGIWRPTQTPFARQWHLRNCHSPGPASITPFYFGDSNWNDQGIVGDWDGDGIRTAGVTRVVNGVIWWHLRNDHGEGPAPIQYPFGQTSTGDVPVVGDWDGDGHDGIGVVRANGGGLQWHLENNFSGDADVTANYGNATDRAVPGDWDGDGDDTLGVTRVNGNTIRWYMRNDLLSQLATIERNYGQWSPTFDRTIAGDWNGDGTHTLGITRNRTDGYIEWHLKNSLNEGPADFYYPYGFVALDKEVRGDWDNATPVSCP